MSQTGLTEEQVKSRISQGKTNYVQKKSTSTTTWKIILKNTLTVFNLVNLILALMIILVGSYKNLLFILIAIANTLISIVNEIRAKRTIDKLKLLTEQQPTVIRDGSPRQINQSEIVEGDLIVYSLGDQILVDSKVTEGTIEVNESFITGEQDNIEKRQGDTLTSGSFVVSGTCKATVTHVGADNFLTKLQQNAAEVKTADSKLFTILNNIVKYISYALIPIGALLLWARFRTEADTVTAVTSTVAALINMIPEGLVLLTSSVLALATIRLSRKQVLVQDLYSVETLARVDTIALDKTGTLTTGKMAVHDYTPLEKSFEKALASILTSQTSENATITALKAKFAKTTKFGLTEQIQEIISFSSDRKHSGIRTNKATYLLGAVEFITDDKAIIKEVTSASAGYRTLALVKCEESPRSRSIFADGANTERLSPVTTGAKERSENDGYSRTVLLGYIRLEDELRKDAAGIINYFYDNDIAVKIISGDNLKTVTTIAEKVGVRDLTGVDLSTEKSPNYSKLVKQYSIFTRVTPVQKKHLIQAMKKQGSTVAMTGDGVNDILAMKEADVSLAIGEGSDAARRSAKLVLLNSDFSAVPSIIDEGRQSINNLERSATLFLTKTTYASILAVLFVILPLSYPYSPIEMTLLNTTLIGLPGLILALEKNTARIKDQFLKNIKKFSIPTGLTVAVSMLILAIVAEINNFPRHDLTVFSAIITFIIGYTLIYRISRPLNLFRATLLAVILAIVLFAFLFPLLHNLIFTL